MKRLLLLTVVVGLLFSCVQQKSPDTTTTTVYYLIRHAEKDRSDPENKNPELTEAGHKRAQKWAEVFSGVPFDVVYSTNYNRTLQTAGPTAMERNITITMYDPRAMEMEVFKKETRGKTVLIVGHSNTTPKLVNNLLGNTKYASIDDTNNANLYIVTISGDTITDIVLKVI